MKNNTISAPKFAQIMGINVLSTTTHEVLSAIKDKLSHSSVLEGRNNRFSIVTPNPELVVMAQDNTQVRKALNSADFPVPDGVGLNYASKFLFGKQLTIIPGRKLFMELIKLADTEGWKVFFLGGTNGEASLARQKLSNSYKKIKIQSDSGPILNNNGDIVTEVNIKSYKDLIDRINKFSPQILFIAFGNPKQEIWIHNNLSKLNVGGAMAVGGTFRYIANLSELPPERMEKSGLEWLWRLITEPYRFKRVFQAVVVFPLKVFWYKIANSSRAR